MRLVRRSGVRSSVPSPVDERSTPGFRTSGSRLESFGQFRPQPSRGDGRQVGRSQSRVSHRVVSAPNAGEVCGRKLGGRLLRRARRLITGKMPPPRTSPAQGDAAGDASVETGRAEDVHSSGERERWVRWPMLTMAAA